MRKVMFSISISLDGFFEGPDGGLGWAIVDEELHQHFNDLESTVDAHLYGRRMWETMSAYWPTADTDPSASAIEVEYALIWQKMPKIVFSKTLAEVEGNARLVRSDIVDEVTKLKAQPGKDLAVGGAAIAAALMRAGLIDDHRIYVHPVILGGGTRLFSALDRPIELKLVETRTFSSGVVLLRYQPGEGQPGGST